MKHDTLFIQSSTGLCFSLQRSPVLLKSLLYHWDFAASKTGAKIVPTCDLLTLSMFVRSLLTSVRQSLQLTFVPAFSDITAQLLRPTSATMSLTTTFDSPLVGLLDAAIESHIVRKEWNGQRGILFPSNEDGSNDQGARIRTVWDREDEPITQSASREALSSGNALQVFRYRLHLFAYQLPSDGALPHHR